MKNIEQKLIFMGIVGVISYFIHTILGRILWASYNPITMDISSLTAKGAPNRNLLMVFTFIYGISMILFCIGMIIYSYNRYNITVRLGWGLFLAMNIVSMVGYSMFPLTGDKTVMNFQNTMHIVVTMFIVLSTIIATFTLAYGYLVKEKMKGVGIFTLIMAIVITFTGLLNPIGMANGWNILGLTERASIYSIQLLMFFYSIYTLRYGDYI